MVYDSWAAATQTLSLFGCAGQQSDNGWRGLSEPAVPLGFVNAVRGGWRGSSAFISTFRDAHSSGWLLQPISPSLSPHIVSVSAVNFLLSLSADQCLLSPFFSQSFCLFLAFVSFSVLWVDHGLCCFRLADLAASLHKAKGYMLSLIYYSEGLWLIHTFVIQILRILFLDMCASQMLCNRVGATCVCGKLGTLGLSKRRV